MHGFHGVRRARFIASAAFALAILPACSATAGHKSRGAVAGGGRAGSTYVYRPLYGTPPARSLFLSGYAGVNYATGSPGVLVTPTAYELRPSHPLKHLLSFGRPGHSH